MENIGEFSGIFTEIIPFHSFSFLIYKLYYYFCTGIYSINCSYEENYSNFSFAELYNLVKNRKENPIEGSYTNYLFDKGVDKILKKVGEEATEVIIGAKNNDKQEVVYEVSDLAYHLIVLMIEQGITLEEVKLELANRHVIDKKIKQEKMV